MVAAVARAAPETVGATPDQLAEAGLIVAVWAAPGWSGAGPPISGW